MCECVCVRERERECVCVYLHTYKLFLESPDFSAVVLQSFLHLRPNTCWHVMDLNIHLLQLGGREGGEGGREGREGGREGGRGGREGREGREGGISTGPPHIHVAAAHQFHCLIKVALDNTNCRLLLSCEGTG